MKWLFFTIIRAALACLIAYVASEAHAQSLTLLGTWTHPSGADSASYVDIAGTDAFIATDKGSLKIVDVSNPSATRLRGELQLTDATKPNGTLAAVKVSGNYAYLLGAHFWNNALSRESRLYIVNISNRNSPSLAGFLTLPAADYVDGRGGLDVVGNMVYIATPGLYLVEPRIGLQVIDASNPAAPTIIGSYITAGDLTWDVEVIDGLAYLAAGSGGLIIADVTNPANIWRVGGISDGIYANSVAVSGNTACIAGVQGGGYLAVYNVSNPVAPTRSGGRFVGSGGANRVTVNGLHAYVAASGDGTVIFNISNPANPTKAGQLPPVASASDVKVIGPIAYIADSQAGLTIYDVASPSVPHRLGGFAVGLSVTVPDAITVGNGLAFVRDSFNGVRIFDVSNTAQPTNIATYRIPSVGPSVVSGSKLYVGTVGGFDIVDISNPTAPAKLGAYRSAGGIVDLAIVGNYVYTSLGEVINVTDPANPTFGATFDANGIINLESEGNYVFAVLGGVDSADRHFFHGGTVIDATNPAAPARRGTYLDSGPTYTATPPDITVSKGFIYVSVGPKVIAFDARNPANIVRLTTRDNGLLTPTVAASGTALYQSRGVYIDLLNVSEPSIPTLVASNKVSEVAGLMDIAVAGTNAFGITQIGGSGAVILQIYTGDPGPETPTPILPRLSAFHQNGNVIVRWPTNFPGLKLYSTPNLGDLWQLVTSNVPISGDSYSFTNTRPVGASLFYKLSSN